MDPSSLPDVELVVRTMAETIVANEAYFSQLDAVVADGDFGYSLARGFSEVLAGFDQFDRSSPSTFLKKVALVISSKVGGASGPLWGTAFLRAAAACDQKQTLAPEDVIAMLRAAAGGIQHRGGAVLGDKTLLDALIPATDALQSSLQSRGQRRGGDPACRRRGPPRRRGNIRYDRQEGTRCLHRRAQHRQRGCGRGGRRRDRRGRQRRLA